MTASCWLTTAFSLIALVHGDVSCPSTSDAVLSALSFEDSGETLSLLQRQAVQFTGGQQSCGDCSGHGSCAGTACNCETFWAGRDCSFFLASNLEEPHQIENPALLVAAECQGGCGDGICVAGVCQCPVGQFGPSCAESQCPHNCFGHGSCISGACSCEFGWVGTDCGQGEAALYSRLEVLAQDAADYATVTESLASNLAQQLADADRAKAAEKAAEEERRAAEEAKAAAASTAAWRNSLQILHDATSSQSAAAAKAAAKGAVSSGDSLEVLHNATSTVQGCSFGCSGHGECNAAEHTCTCESGWAGDFCDQPRCEEDCSNHGLCVNGRCLCKETFYGNICQHARCPSDCSGNGYCFQGKCQCSGIWGGATCSVRLHSTGVVRMAIPKHPSLIGLPDPEHSTLHASAQVFSCPGACSGHGSCVHGACSCQPGFHGIICGKASGCGGHGTFDSSETCQCDDGWGGSDCLVELICADVFCGGQGSCVTGKCVCSPGFGGPTCRLVLKAVAPASPKKDLMNLLHQAAQNRSGAPTLASSPMTASWIPVDERANAIQGPGSSSADSTSDLAQPQASSAKLTDTRGLSEAEDHLTGQRTLTQRLLEALAVSTGRSQDSNTM